MLKHFRGSPLWLIGLFVIFAEGVSAIAAIQLNGWSQEALVRFVIFYASAVTLIFFAFLWFKPENFYSPADYTETSPRDFIRAIRKLPTEVESDVSKLSQDPGSTVKLFKLMSNLLKDEVKQHLILMARTGSGLNISRRDDHGHTHHYQFLLRNGNMSFGVFDPQPFIRALDGTEMVMVNGDKKSIQLLPEGFAFAEWLMRHKLDAESFQSDQGSWGEAFDPFKRLKQHSQSTPDNT